MNGEALHCFNMIGNSFVPDKDVAYMARDARGFAFSNGLVVPQYINPCCGTAEHLPFTLLPTPFSRRLYDECLAVQPIINTLLVKLARDVPFINEVLKNQAAYDVITEGLLGISSDCEKEGYAQPIQSCISRSDYMMDVFQTGAGNKSVRARQVEISSPICWHATSSQIVTELHDYIRSKYKLDAYNSAGHLYPKNEAGDLVAAGLIDAYDLYGKAGSYILIVGGPMYYDQVRLELIVRKSRPDIHFTGCSFYGFEESVKLGPNKELLVDGNKEIAVVYFPNPKDSDSDFWFSRSTTIPLRLRIEQSRAIKCPSINFRLASTGRFQQVLASQENLEKFLDASDSNRLAQTFCRFWSLDNTTNEGKEGYSMALNNYDKLVMKPQSKQLGRYYFGRDLKNYLLRDCRNRVALSRHFLMDLINSPKERNWLMFRSEFILPYPQPIKSNRDLVSELGIYGSVIASRSEILSNKSAGYLVRSRLSGALEFDVNNGEAGLSSLVLIDDTKAE